MKKIYQLAAVLALTTQVVFPSTNQATAQVTEQTQEQTKEDLSTRIQKVHGYVLNNEKGERKVFEAGLGTTVLAKYNYDNKEYLLVAFEPNKNDVTGKDLNNELLIATHKSYEDKGEYFTFVNQELISELMAAEQIVHTLGQNEEYLSSEAIITGILPLTESQLIERKIYTSGAGEEEAQGEEHLEFFETEFDKTIDELLKFYESE